MRKWQAWQRPAPARLWISPDPEPWPDPVEGVRLLEEMTTLLATYITAPRAAIDAAALWVLYTHIFVRVELPVAVRLFLTSATKRCGKSRLLRLLAALAIRPLTVSRMSTAAFYRIAQNLKPILFLDEADGFIAESPEFRNLINAGFEQEGALVVVNVPSGDTWAPAGFYIFTPIALAGIGKLADTIEDRAIKLLMQRQAPDEKKPRLRMREVRHHLDEIKRRAMRWAIDNATAVAEARPALPPALDDRAADFWEMLLAVAAVAAGDWPARANQAAIALSGGRHGDDDSISVRLLKDIRAVFEASDADRLASKTMCEKLAAIEDAPWSEISRGKPITQNRLARLLEPFNVAPMTIREGNLTMKGYLRESFQAAFTSYFPDSKRHSVTPQRPEGESADYSSVTGRGCDGSTDGAKPTPDRGCDGVTDEKSGWEHETEPLAVSGDPSDCDAIDLYPEPTEPNS